MANVSASPMERWLRSWIEPSLLISETHFPWSGQHDTVIAAIERLVQDSFFERFEWMVADLPRQYALRLHKLVSEHGLALVVWSPPAIDSPGCSLSSLDPSIRRVGVELVKNLIDRAAASGATTVCVRSGPDVNASDRQAAMGALADSLIRLSEHGQQAGGLQLLLEPLDRYAHKRMLIGSAADAVQLAQTVGADGRRFALCWDSGHTLLNGEDWSDALNLCWPFTRQLHLSSPVLNPQHPWFGDTHGCVGEPPGVLDLDTVTSILECARRLCQRDGKRIAVAVEERNWPGTSPDAFVRHARRILVDACGAVYAREENQ